MRNIVIITLAVVAMAAAPAWADQTGTFGWEDGVSTALGHYGDNVTYVNSDEQAHEGTRSLKITESPSSGTPQVFVWWVTGLVDGDTVTASFWVYDTVDSGNPSGRIWGHYTSDPMDVDSYSGSAGGNDTYSDGLGWSELIHTWTFASSGDDDGLMVEARIYSAADGDFIYVDDAVITVTSDTAIVYAADGSVVPVELMSFSIE